MKTPNSVIPREKLSCYVGRFIPDCIVKKKEKLTLVWYNRKKRRKYTKFSNSERKTVLLAGFFPGDIRVTVDN